MRLPCLVKPHKYWMCGVLLMAKGDEKYELLDFNKTW